MSITSTQTNLQESIKAVCFDFMGTCLDWHSTIVSALPHQLSEHERSKFALNWRQAFFDANATKFNNGEAPEDIDLTHRRTLDELLEAHKDINHYFTQEIRTNAVKAWHDQTAWPDVSSALKKLKDRGWEIFVLANGTTRLQLDLVKSSGLHYDMLFSSELLGVYKPAPESYATVMKLIKRRPEQCVMVAAHAYDVRAAKRAGMRTIYVYRWTDDTDEDQTHLEQEFDAYLVNMDELDVVVAHL